MSLTRFNRPIELSTWGADANDTGRTVNAAGESCFVIGRLWTPGGPGTSKTISGAGGGKILMWNQSGATFADAGTTVRMGIQDVDATTGIEDTTFDVYKDRVGGTDTFTNTITMATGSKTIAHGDLIAIGAEMTSRGGTDSFIWDAQVTDFGELSASNFPYGTADTGSGPAKSSICIQAAIIFDDGSYGWIEGAYPFFDTQSGLNATTAVSSSTTPDEIAVTFSMPCSCTLAYWGFWLTGVATGETFEYILYSDPLGTPVAIETITMDPDVQHTAGGIIRGFLTTERDLTAGVTYGLALRPTTTGSITFNTHSIADSDHATFCKTTGFWSGTLKETTRTDQTGAFAETATGRRPVCVMGFSRFDNGTGSGGGASSFTFVG